MIFSEKQSLIYRKTEKLKELCPVIKQKPKLKLNKIPKGITLKRLVTEGLAVNLDTANLWCSKI